MLLVVRLLELQASRGKVQLGNLGEITDEGFKVWGPSLGFRIWGLGCGLWIYGLCREKGAQGGSAGVPNGL